MESKVAGRVVYEGRIIEVQVDQVRLADGALATREVVVHPGSVAVLALDADDRVLLVSQYRYAAGQQLLEIPAGRLDPGETPAEAAARELAEEANLAAGSLTQLVSFYVSPGYATEILHAFVAERLRSCIGQADEDERITTHWVSLPEAVAMCLDGRILDAKTITIVLSLAAARHGWSRGAAQGVGG